MHRLNNMNAAEMNRLAMLHKDQVTWIAFIENVSYKTQLYVLENKDVEDLLNVIYNIGGIVRRDDLINIYFNGDKNKYALISKMAKFNLLKIEGSRKAIIGLTSASLSIIRKKVEKNSKKPSSSTSNLILQHFCYIQSKAKEYLWLMSLIFAWMLLILISTQITALKDFAKRGMICS